jgi:hypothetical protein
MQVILRTPAAGVKSNRSRRAAHPALPGTTFTDVANPWRVERQVSIQWADTYEK